MLATTIEQRMTGSYDNNSLPLGGLQSLRISLKILRVSDL